MVTLAQFKRDLEGARLTLTESSQLVRGEWTPLRHKFLGVPRAVRVRSRDMVLTDSAGEESYMQWGRANNWTIDNGRAVFEELELEYGTRLVYEISREKREENE